MITLTDICYSYTSAHGTTVALDGVSLQVGPGEQVAVLGGNGSGKSTLVRLVNGLLLAESGVVLVDGIDSRDQARSRELRERVGIVFQRPDDQIVATSVEDDVAFGPENLGLERVEIRRRVDEALSAVGLTGLERREPHLLSGGQKQRLAIAGALAMRPAYLVLDEPASMLDPSGRSEVLEIVERLRASGTGVLHVTHDLSDVLWADRVVVLDRGRLVFEGMMPDLIERPELLAASGLELPPISVLVTELRARGAVLARGIDDAPSLVEALWR